MFQSQVHCSVIVFFNKDCSGTGMYNGKARTRGAGGNAMKVQVVYGQWSKSQSGGCVVENQQQIECEVRRHSELETGPPPQKVTFFLLATMFQHVHQPR